VQSGVRGQSAEQGSAAEVVFLQAPVRCGAGRVASASSRQGERRGGHDDKSNEGSGGGWAARQPFVPECRSAEPTAGLARGRWWNIPASPIRWLLALALAFTLSAHPGPKER